MKATQFKDLTPKRKFIKYKIHDHALGRIKKRFPEIKGGRDQLAHQLSIIIFGAKELPHKHACRRKFFHKGIIIIVDRNALLILTIYDSLQPPEQELINEEGTNQNSHE